MFKRKKGQQFDHSSEPTPEQKLWSYMNNPQKPKSKNNTSETKKGNKK